MNHCERTPLPTCENEDEKRLAMLSYNQEVKRIFNAFTNFGNYYYFYYNYCVCRKYAMFKFIELFARSYMVGLASRC